jgi:hypothetical protein
LRGRSRDSDCRICRLPPLLLATAAVARRTLCVG